MKKIAVLNNKGGVGKSTIFVQLSHGLAKLGFKVLLLDLDGQSLGFSSSERRYLQAMGYYYINVVIFNF
ncbi:UNVERIFIED_CONTAM: AAA domain-containing protein [Acetivibrio alkalicellulosi]